MKQHRNKLNKIIAIWDEDKRNNKMLNKHEIMKKYLIGICKEYSN